MFISPHISSFRERYQINGNLCTVEELVETCDLVFDAVIKNNFDVRFFEIVTILGFLIFKKNKCDYVVLECGLGGKLDATNVCQYPDVIVSTIASIGWDHMEVLGNSLDLIAKEKSGVIKANVPCVLGNTCRNKEIEARIEQTGSQAHWIEAMETFS
jgi:dihydrofolate synthase/folylpolyglutamate synthase